MLPQDAAMFDADVVAQGLPDESMLLAALARLDFGERSDAVLFGYICEGIRLFSIAFGRHSDTAKFDWTKLLPRNPIVFCQAPVFIQKMVLVSIRTTLSSRRVSKHNKQACE